MRLFSSRKSDGTQPEYIRGLSSEHGESRLELRCRKDPLERYSLLDEQFPVIMVNIPYSSDNLSYLKTVCYNMGPGQWFCEPLLLAQMEARRAITYAQEHSTLGTVVRARETYDAFRRSKMLEAKEAASSWNSKSTNPDTIFNPIPTFDETLIVANVQSMLDTQMTAHKRVKLDVVAGMMPPDSSGVTATALEKNLADPQGSRLKRLPEALQEAKMALIRQSEEAFWLKPREFQRTDPTEWDGSDGQPAWRTRETDLKSHRIIGKPKTSLTSKLLGPFVEVGLALAFWKAWR